MAESNTSNGRGREAASFPWFFYCFCAPRPRPTPCAACRLTLPCAGYEIGPDNPPSVCPPGCTDPAHAEALGCASCTLDFLKSQKRFFYVASADGALPPPTYFCLLCNKADMERKL